MFTYEISDCFLTYKLERGNWMSYTNGDAVYIVQKEDCIKIYSPAQDLTICNDHVVEMRARVGNTKRLLKYAWELPYMSVRVEGAVVRLSIKHGTTYEYTYRGFTWDGEWLIIIGMDENIHLNSQTYEGCLASKPFWFEFSMLDLLQFQTIDDELSVC